MRFEFLVAFRYLWDTRRTRFLSFISLITISGVAIGVLSLVVVQSVMDGLQGHMRKTILGAKAHVILESKQEGKLNAPNALMARISRLPEVAGATPFIRRDAMVSRAGELLGAVVTGIDKNSMASVYRLPKEMRHGSIACMFDSSACDFNKKTKQKQDDTSDVMAAFARDLRRNNASLPGVIIGSEMAAFYAVSVGDTISIISPTGTTGLSSLPATRKVRIAGIFYSGLYEFDLNYLYMSLADAQKFFGAQGVDGIAVRLKSPDLLEKVRPAITAAVSPDSIRIRDWKSMNKAIFGALNMERLVWFLIMGFVVLVAGFNVVSMLIMVVLGKRREIAVLKTIGASNKSISLIFLIQGAAIGIIGTVIGLIAAFGVVSFLDGRSIGAGNEIYYLTTIPVDASPLLFVTIGIGTLLLTTAASFYPGVAAAKIRPADGLRHE